MIKILVGKFVIMGVYGKIEGGFERMKYECVVLI